MNFWWPCGVIPASFSLKRYRATIQVSELGQIRIPGALYLERREIFKILLKHLIYLVS